MLTGAGSKTPTGKASKAGLAGATRAQQKAAAQADAGAAAGAGDDDEPDVPDPVESDDEDGDVEAGVDPAPPAICIMPGCGRPKYPPHEFCGRTCAAASKASKEGGNAENPPWVTVLLSRIQALEKQVERSTASASRAERSVRIAGAGSVDEGARMIDLTAASPPTGVFDPVAAGTSGAGDGPLSWPQVGGFVHQVGANPCARLPDGALPALWSELFREGSKHTTRDRDEVYTLHTMGSYLFDALAAIGYADTISDDDLRAWLVDISGVLQSQVLDRIYTRLDVLRQVPQDRAAYGLTIDPQALTHRRGPLPFTQTGRELEERIAQAKVRSSLRSITGEKEDETTRTRSRTSSLTTSSSTPRTTPRPTMPARGALRGARSGLTSSPSKSTSGAAKEGGSAAK